MAKTPSDVVAERIRAYRLARGWSVAQLADECERLGAPQLTHASLVNIERGQGGSTTRKRRDVTVDELLILGYALAVPALLLLVPLGEEDEIAVASIATLHPHLAWKVITAEEPLVTTSRKAYRLREWRDAARPAHLFAELSSTQRAFRNAETEWRLAEQSGNRERMAVAREAYADALTGFARSLNNITNAGLRPPAYPAEWVKAIRDTGLVDYPDELRIFDGDADG